MERVEEELVIVFVDLTLFQKQAQQVDPRELADTIDEFYERVSDAVERAAGTLIKFIGDAALIVFRPEDLAPAVAMLLALKPDVDAFMEGAGWQCRLTVRVHLGPVVAGPFGPRQAKRFDVIGVTVNAGAKLPSTGVTISRRVYDGLPGDLKARFKEGSSNEALVRLED